MEITVERKWKRPGYTVGVVEVDGKRWGDGVRWCSSLEDTDRGLSQAMGDAEIRRRKVAGRTAIPTGRYRVKTTYSPRFGKRLPLLENVPGFDGVRIHAGNTAADTAGCILLGENSAKGKVLNSRYWCARMQALIEKAERKGERVWIEIK